MLKELFVRYAIVGHSERLEFFAETNEAVNKLCESRVGGGHPAHRLRG